MGGSRLTVAGAIVGVIGTALLLTEGIRAVTLNDVLSSVSQVLMWIGLGLMAVGGLLLVAGIMQDPSGGVAGAPDEPPAA